MVGLGSNLVESMGSQRRDHFRDLEQRRDQEGSLHTTHTSRSHSRGGSHLSYKKNIKAMQLEIDHLRRSLRHEWRKRAPSISNFYSDGEEVGSYRCKSRTPPSESFSYDEDYHHEHRDRNLSSKGLGNDAMSRALNQISRSPFTPKIERRRLPRQFIQPTFTIYNGQTDPVEHVSHFNQRMTMHSKNKALMCKIFLSSLRPVTMKWYDGLGAGSIGSYKELT